MAATVVCYVDSEGINFTVEESKLEKHSKIGQLQLLNSQMQDVTAPKLKSSITTRCELS